MPAFGCAVVCLLWTLLPDASVDALAQDVAMWPASGCGTTPARRQAI
jgi:hypothetical protein